jgi:hypothetical protein
MTTTVTWVFAIFTWLCVVSPIWAASCAPSIAALQAKVDAAIERRAGKDGWKPQSLDATRNYQPTPFSLAATEGPRGRDLEVALDSLDRARAADRIGYIAACRQALASVRSILRAHHTE